MTLISNPKWRSGLKSARLQALNRNKGGIVGIAKILAERISASRHEDLPPETIYWCKVAVMDTLGVAPAGSREPAPNILRDVLAPVGGPSLVYGTSQRVPCLDAAHINGAAAHALDFDNTAAHFAGHISAVMVPALIAAGEAFNSKGRDLLLAHAVGYDAGCRIGRGVNVDLYQSEKRWHPTSTLGVFDAPSIATIETWTPAFGLSYTHRPDPQGDLDAKFSVQYCAVKALLSGRVVLEDFENQAYRDAMVQSVLPRVRSEQYTGKMFDPADPFDAELKLTLTDGRTLFAKVDRPLGRTSEIPIPYEQLQAKFENCAGRVLAQDAVVKSLQLIDLMDKNSSVLHLTQALETIPAADGERRVA
jgi:2-methylcitrate dehydratase PrpD